MGDKIFYSFSLQDSSKPLQSRFLLSDQLYCTADVPPTEKVMLWLGVKDYLLSKLVGYYTTDTNSIVIIFLLSLFFFLNQTTLEGLPGICGDKGTLAKYWREEGNMSLFLGNRGTQLYKLESENKLSKFIKKGTSKENMWEYENIRQFWKATRE